ncbi:MAG: 16S rRNA (guanine(966)-N(2))-methyltransferase RsmD [Angelakisella sp.]|nr:16S rRNA (guanine(966)-N(2))-methyltransferase RsmD [Angelakisella sp.]
MRVITGTARGRKLAALEGVEVRPTTDMVKEAMFSILQFEVEGANVLDLFAGSGQLGIEALSRGARACVFVDSSRDSQNITRQNLQHTGLSSAARVAAMDYAAFLRSTKDTFDIALLDPPYEKGLAADALPLLVDKMSPGGAILCETRKGEPMPERVGEFAIHRTYRYGKIALTLYRRVEEEREEAEG